MECDRQQDHRADHPVHHPGQRASTLLQPPVRLFTSVPIKLYEASANGFGSVNNFPQPRCFKSGSAQTSLPATVSLATPSNDLFLAGAS